MLFQKEKAQYNQDDVQILLKQVAESYCCRKRDLRCVKQNGHDRFQEDDV